MKLTRVRYQNIKFPDIEKSYELMGWTKKHVFLKIEGLITIIDMDCVKFNKSALWRKNYDDSQKIMGKPPKFKPPKFENNYKNINENKPKKDDILDGKSVDTLTETECQVYLKLALDKEDYELAEKIKKQMEKFR